MLIPPEFFNLTRHMATFAVATVTTCVAALTVPSSASAQPAPEDLCTYQLSGPELTELPGGAKAVTATLTPTTCPGRAKPTNTTICVATPDGPGSCANSLAWIPAQVYVTTASYTGTFTATGNGCYKSMFAGDCTSIGPISATL
jgi:hypothetical protein